MRRAVGILAAAAVVLIAGVPARGTPAAPRKTPVPVLMYHAIADPPARAPFRELWVGQAEFAAELRALAARGYRAVTLSQLYEHWFHGGPLPKKPIVLTFDDGYRSVYENAFPLLRARGWPGVVNLEVRFLDKSWGLSRTRIKRMLVAHWELASHTIDHVDVTGLSGSALAHEVTDSRFLLQRIFRVPVWFFCYPAGRYDARAIAAVKAAGYHGATSTRHGLAQPDELYTLARVRVNRGDGAVALVRKLAGLQG